MAERQLPKLHTRVRFPSPAPLLRTSSSVCRSTIDPAFPRSPSRSLFSVLVPFTLTMQLTQYCNVFCFALGTSDIANGGRRLRVPSRRTNFIKRRQRVVRLRDRARAGIHVF